MESAWGIEHGVISKSRDSKRWEKQATQAHPYERYQDRKKYMQRPFAFNERGENRRRGAVIGTGAGLLGGLGAAPAFRSPKKALIVTGAATAAGTAGGVLTGHFARDKHHPTSPARRKQHNANLRNTIDQQRHEYVQERRAERDADRDLRKERHIQNRRAIGYY